MLSIAIVAELLLVVFVSISITASPKATQRIFGGVYSPGDDFGSVVSGGVASYGNATFYTPNADQTGDGMYDVQYYNCPLSFYPGAPSGYPYCYGTSDSTHVWPVAEHLSNNVAGVTEYMVIVETINGVNGWTGANFTGSTNTTATAIDEDTLPNIYLEQIPIPNLKSINYTTGTIIINWTGLNEYISDYCFDGAQKWKIQTSNILNYSVYRSTNGGAFVTVGNSTAQIKGGEVYFVDTVDPDNYEYRIAVNYRYEANTGTSVIDQNGVNPANTNFLGMFVSTGRSNVSGIITMLDVKKPTITNIHPENSTTVITNTTVISANYNDVSGIRLDSVLLKVDNIDVTDNATVTAAGISYIATDLVDKEYNVYLYIEDNSSDHNNASINWSFTVAADIESPKIENMQPEDGSVLTTNITTISASYSDPSGIDTNSVILRVNGVNYTSEAMITGTSVSYYYTNMSDGNYTVYLEVKDNSSNHNKAAKTWSFTVDITHPEVVEALPTGDEVLVFDEVDITFSEPMDTTVGMADIFSITPNPGGWVWEWNATGELLRGTHNAFTVNTTYSCTINTNATDKAGNPLDKDYSWNFTTISGLSVTLNWPYIGTERWTGGSEHTINYSVGGGLPSYEVKIYYSYNGGDWNFTAFDNQTEGGTYEYIWMLPLIDSDTAQVRVEVIDALDETLAKTSNYFIIDSTKPTVNQTSPLNSSYTPLGCDIVIVFDESMNTATVGASGGSLLGCNCTPDPGGWVAIWSDGDKKLTLSHNDFNSSQLYTFTATTDAKDKSDPGNHLNNSYSWNFTAVPGKGVFTVSIDWPPTSSEVSKEYQVTVTVNNAGLPTAYNTSGTLTVNFYKFHAGETPVLFDTKTINAMSPVDSDTKSSIQFTFDKPGTWYIKVEISSTNSIDVIQGYPRSYDVSNSVEVVKPEEAPAGIPYLTIGGGVILLLVLIGVAVTLIKKKK